MSSYGPEPTVTDDELLVAIDEIEPPAVTAGYVSARVEIGKERVRQRLNSLSDMGELQRYKGETIVLYWRS